MKTQKKVNVIDLFVLLLLVAVVALGAFVVVKKTATPPQDSLVFTFFLDEASDFVADKVVEGCRLYDDNNSNDLGICKEVVIGDAISYGTSADGQVVVSSRPGMRSVKIVGSVMGEKTDNGVKVGGVQYCVGDYLVLRAGDAKLYIPIYALDVEQ